MKFSHLNIAIFAFWLCSCVQTNTSSQNNKQADIKIGDACDQCEIMYEGIPAVEKINSQSTIANEVEPGNRMEISGKVLMKDGKTPAPGIIVYMYHTNAKGYYAAADTQTTGKLHGHLRGWVKTNEAGNFKFNSIRPSAYPGRNIPAHLHLLIKEPGKTLYYVDEVWFDDDSLVTKELRQKTEKRGGDLITHLEKDLNNVWQGNIIITCGLNIPDYQ